MINVLMTVSCLYLQKERQQIKDLNDVPPVKSDSDPIPATLNNSRNSTGSSSGSDDEKKDWRAAWLIEETNKL